jgi:N-terminal phage replisome organiser (Phage_rep_org_N)
MGRNPLFRVRNWGGLYENNRSREIAQTRWFPAPNDLSAYWYVALVTHENGAAHFGVWNALLMIASKATPRGFLMREDGTPHTAESLARVTRFPEQLIRTAIRCLLDIGLLETEANKPRQKSKLKSHLGAVASQAPAVESQEDAAEGKGRERHHQEEKGTEKKGTERAREELKTEDSRASASAAAASSQNGDDVDQNPRVGYASSEDELKAIYRDKAGEIISVELLDAIRVNLELARVTLSEFVEEVRKHAGNKWKNPPGFLRDLSKRFRAKTRAAGAPVTAAEAVARDYQCPRCFSRRPGEGAVLDGENGPVPCICASAEYIAKQQERGFFKREPAP